MNWLPQCMGMNACASRTCSLASTRTTSSPRRLLTRTISPDFSPRRSMSRACIASSGSSTWLNRRAAVPVRLNAVPLIAQPSRVQCQRIARIGFLRGGRIGGNDEARAPAGGRENAVGIKPREPGRSTLRERPLLRAPRFEQFVTQSGDIEIASRVLSRCSLKICSGVVYANRRAVSGLPSFAPRRCAKSTAIAQSCRASPGAATAARTRVMRRSSW